MNVEEPDNYDDSYLDKKITRWTEIIPEIEKLKNLKKAWFTRKTFIGIPNMKGGLETISSFCKQKDIPF